jgi:site-specific DNA-methyltransferase (adenine-specific)
VAEIVTIGDATLYHGDCLEWIAGLPDCFRVDCLLTDPPFGVGNFVQITGSLRGDPVTWNESGPPPEWFAAVRRIAKHRIIWGANFFNCFEPDGGAIVWVKRQAIPNFSKADIASCTKFQKTEIVEIPWSGARAKTVTDHPCERPVSLYEWCIEYIKGCGTYLDTYMGSGSVGVACVNQGKKFIGIERERKYFDAACERISAAYDQGRLFS